MAGMMATASKPTRLITVTAAVALPHTTVTHAHTHTHTHTHHAVIRHAIIIYAEQKYE